DLYRPYTPKEETSRHRPRRRSERLAVLPSSGIHFSRLTLRLYRRQDRWTIFSQTERMRCGTPQNVASGQYVAKPVQSLKAVATVPPTAQPRKAPPRMSPTE